MSEEYKQLLHQAILEEPSFVKATFTGRRQDDAVPWIKVVLRPVVVKDQKYVQFAYYDAKKCLTKNCRADLLIDSLNDLLDLPFRNVHVSSTQEELRIQVTAKGKAIVHRAGTVRPANTPNLSHDRQKALLLPGGKPDAYLQAIGFMTQDGEIKADKQKKFKQTNEFLKLIQQTGELEKFAKPLLEIVDFGCGNAYLTFAVYHYLNDKLHIPARMVGVDVRGELLEKHARTAEALGWDNITFVKSAIADYVPSAPPDITLALHACDTATDEALAQGIQWGSKLIISVPCCHHNLQERLGKLPAPEPFQPIRRHGILAERLGDILTDAFRALILRIMGYQTDVLQFVSAEHTAKNIMIRAVKSSLPAPPQLVREYAQMKAYWQTTPYLEPLLGEIFAERFSVSGE